LPRYAAFLRGINVTGTRIRKDDLCAPFAALGLEDVTTFRASGNVIFDGPRRSARALAKDIEAQLAADLGFSKAVTYVRTAKEMRALAAADPLPATGGAKVHVFFLTQRPPAATQKKVLALATTANPLRFGERELFWRTPGRMIDSDLDLKAIEKLIGPTTMRTKGTVDQIAERFF
jgi:uncharacterized protein (DUF1697 family)